MIFLELFWSFFRIGLFTFGGGYAALPLIKAIIVESNRWMTMAEFTDLITISEMTPGPIAVNSASFVGMHIAGVGGAIAATLGCILPSCLVISVLTYLYYKHRKLKMVQGVLSGLRPAVVALIASAGLSVMFLAFWGKDSFLENLNQTNYMAIGIFILALYVLRKFKPSPIYIMAGSGVIGLVGYLLTA